ncbi:MAG: hypothetical protein Q4B18_00995 [Bacillota bacterium]|nr:hypothetical protein [Bacillota bacterium]
MYTELREVLNEFKDELKVEITGELRQEMRGMEDRLTTRLDKMDDRFDGIDDRLDVIEGRLSDVENDVTSIKLTLENEIKPNISRIADGYSMLEERLDREAAEEREYRRRIDYRLAALANQN